MSIMWQGSLVPWTTGVPYSGAKAYFYDAGTTTPKVTYTDASLSTTHDHPVEANSAGKFPAIFLIEETTYRVRITTAAGVTLDDVDGISVPTATPPEAPTGETAAEFLFQTGHILIAYRTAAPNGYVRMNGRTIGSAASGATERANADAEALFLHLWTQDPNLVVSGGRGGTATGDFSAAKTIALPDWRGRSPFGLDSMGNSAAGRITDAVLGADSDTLGSAGGAQTHALVTAELASHTHTGTTGSTQAAAPSIQFKPSFSGDGDGSMGASSGIITASNEVGSLSSPNVAMVALTAGAAHTHTITTDATGSGTAHNNLPPAVLVPFFIKL